MVEREKQRSHEIEREAANQLAPLLDEATQLKQFSSLATTRKYMLLCTDGIFKGKFLFLNMTADGEVFGSGDPDTHDDITMYIEQAELSERHARIHYCDKQGNLMEEDENGEIDEYTGNFLLQDCGSHSGTWIRVTHVSSEFQQSQVVDLHKAADAQPPELFMAGQNLFIVERDSKVIDEVEVWLNDLPQEFAPLKFQIQNSLNVKSLSLLRKNCNKEVLIGHDADLVSRFLGMVQELPNATESLADQLRLKFVQGPLKNCHIQLDGRKQTFGSSSKESNSSHIDLQDASLAPVHFRTQYDAKHRRLLIQSASPDVRIGGQSLFRRLRPNEVHNLVPEDAFRIGSLEFCAQKFNTGIVQEIGQRKSMEDTYCVIQDLQIHSEVPVSYFAAFDGHGGDQCAIYLRDNLHIQIIKALTKPLDGGRPPLSESYNYQQTLHEAMIEAFDVTDLNFQQSFPQVCKTCGSTAVVCLVIGCDLFCFNLGDARAVLCREGRAYDLSVDYKASRKDEQERIKGQGGYIVFGRVLGRLAVTRAFGDFECKQICIKNDDDSQVQNQGAQQSNSNVLQNFVTCQPEVRYAQIDRYKDDFMLLASDGLYDRFSSQECCQIVIDQMSSQGVPPNETDPQAAVEHLVRLATDQRVNCDNTTAILVALNQGMNNNIIGQGDQYDAY